MSPLVTDGEIRTGVNGHRPKVDSPAVSTPARARLPVTQSRRKIGGVAVWRAATTRAARRWWAWTARPLSLRALWRLSHIDPKRVPLRHAGLTTAWRVSNATDRLLMFTLILVAPTALTGPLRWLAARPTRRAGFYLVAAVTLAAFTLIGHAGKE